jgi:hypothetical protein
VAARAAPKCTRKLRRIQGTIVSGISDKLLGELRIAGAYVKLLCIPDDRSEKSISLARIGSCEIRIFEGSQVASDGMRLFWLELFDTPRNNRSTVSVATRSKTPWSSSKTLSHRQIT